MNLTAATSRKVPLVLNGEERHAWYNFAALVALGMKGPADGDGLQAAMNAAVGDFDGAARLVHAGLLWEKRGDTVETVKAALLDGWDMAELAQFVERFAGAMVMDKEGEQGANPPVQLTQNP